VMKCGGNSLVLALAIYEECSFLSRNFSELLCYYPREANRVEHVLASHSEGSQSIVWIEEPPDYFVGILADEVYVISN
jgi:hypothetical protein